MFFLFTKEKYGDIDAMLKKLQAMGYEEVKLVDTTEGLFMTRKRSNCFVLKRLSAVDWQKIKFSDFQKPPFLIDGCFCF